MGRPRSIQTRATEMERDRIPDHLIKAVVEALALIRNSSEGVYATEIFNELGIRELFPIKQAGLGEYRAVVMFKDVLAILELRGYGKRGKDGRYRAK